MIILLAYYLVGMTLIGDMLLEIKPDTLSTWGMVQMVFLAPLIAPALWVLEVILWFLDFVITGDL